MPRVLVVDDDPLVRGLLVRCLHNAGYDTVESPDGSHAIVRLERENGFDVLVTDYSMPGATGLDVIRVAQRVDPTLPAIVVTAFHDMDLAMQAMEAGAVGFLPKPFRPRHLEVVVAHALERRRLAEQTLRLRLMAPMLDRFTMVLANVIEAKDASTHSHCERLVAHADAISMRLGIDNETRANVRLGACLHDVGKIGIPEDLLRTSRSLSETEFEVVREHSVIGAKVLANIDGWEPVRAIVRHHHERFEGGGYRRDPARRPHRRRCRLLRRHPQRTGLPAATFPRRGRGRAPHRARPSVRPGLHRRFPRRALLERRRFRRGVRPRDARALVAARARRLNRESTRAAIP